jgi:general secretion pathway protein F
MRVQVKAVKDAGTIVLYECEALDPEDAKRQASGQGFTVLRVRQLAGWQRGRRGARFPLLLFGQELATLVEAGVPLVEALETLAQKEKTGPVRGVLAGLVATVREGRPLSQAMQLYPAAFPSLFVSTVRAAERTGELPRAITRYVGYQSRIEAVKKTVVNASIYPALLIGVGGLVCLFLLFYVVPRFGSIYEERSSDLPLFSRVLLGWGQLVEANGTLVLAGLSIALAIGVAGMRNARLAERLEALAWRWPAAEERLRTYQLARFYRTAGMLVDGGIPLVTALEMSAGVLHARLRRGLEQAIRAIREGQPVARSLEANGLATAVAMRMLAVGERSGSMGAMMEKSAQFHEEELSRWIEWFSRLFEPLLMALIGLVIGVIVVLMYMPVFELAGSVR